MKQYVLKDDSIIRTKKGEVTIVGGSKIVSDGYIDEDNGIKGIVDSGKHKGIEIIFSIDELEVS